MTLPAGWRTRRPTLDDARAILAVVHASDLFAVGYPDFDLDDVRNALTEAYFDPSRDSWLALDPDDEVVAWSTVSNPTGVGREFVDVYADPGRGWPAQAELLARQLERSAERAGERGLPTLTVRCAACEPERQWRGTLLDTGFAFVKRYARMRRPLADLPTDPPAVPPGVSIRPVRPDDDADLRTFHRIYDTAFRDTADYEPIGYERWRAELDRQPSFAWDEWYVAEAAGVPVGVLQSSDQALDQNEGFVRYLAVLPAHRGRGVGAALLRHAFAGYAAKGRDYAGLGVDLTNPTEAIRLYRSVGLADLRAIDMYERTVAVVG